MSTLARWARRFGLTRAICVLLLFALVPLRILDPAPLEEIRLRTFDFYQSLRPREAVVAPVVIVDIDEASLKEIGQWPWPRTILAGPRHPARELGRRWRSVLTSFLPEPDRMSPSIAATSFRNLDDETRDKLRTLPSNDEVFAQAIRRSRIVVGQAGLGNGGRRDRRPRRPADGICRQGTRRHPLSRDIRGIAAQRAVIEQAAADAACSRFCRARRDRAPRAAGHARASAMVPSLSMDCCGW